MRKVYLFMMVSLDGFFEGPDHDLSWHNVDGEFVDFAVKQLDETGAILFGRRTYEMMAEFWPSEYAKKTDPLTSERMGALPKYVASRSLRSVGWENSHLLGSDAAKDITALKSGPGKPIAILGSNNLCVSLMEAGLVDEFRIMVNPIAIGSGTPLFHGLKGRFPLKLIKTREFGSGNVLLYLKPKEASSVSEG